MSSDGSQCLTMATVEWESQVAGEVSDGRNEIRNLWMSKLMPWQRTLGHGCLDSLTMSLLPWQYHWLKIIKYFLYSFIFTYLKIYLCVCLCIRMSICHRCACPWGPEEGAGSSGAVVTGGCKPPDLGAGSGLWTSGWAGSTQLLCHLSNPVVYFLTVSLLQVTFQNMLKKILVIILILTLQVSCWEVQELC